MLIYSTNISIFGQLFKMEQDNKSKSNLFTQVLLNWHNEYNDRSYAWVGETDPYKIWVSEIMLQQTRADQGEPYYLRFMEKYPDVESLAEAPLDDVLLMWEGLGYYSRCRNLHYSAQYIVREKEGVFPKEYEEILQLKGVGPYTAAAIASFAYKLPYAVVDGNVYRVLSRYFGLDWDLSLGKTQKKFFEFANELIDESQPDIYNQAIMDFGATVCTPRKPMCETCPLALNCVAFLGDIVHLLPIKSKKVKVTKRYLNFFVLRFQDLYFIEQRNENDIWKGLFQFYLIETKSLQKENIKQLIPDHWMYENISYLKTIKQKLTHQEINSMFSIIELRKIPQELLEKGQWVLWESLNEFAYPKTIVSFLEEELLL